MYPNGIQYFLLRNYDINSIMNSLNHYWNISPMGAIGDGLVIYSLSLSLPYDP